MEDTNMIAEELIEDMEPSLLSYTQMQNLKVDDVVWLQDVDKADTIPGIFAGFVRRRNKLAAMFVTRSSGKVKALVDEYWDRWCCWSAKPTQEQCRETPFMRF